MQKSKEIISVPQAILLCTINRFITAYAYLPAINTTPPANQDIWISILISTLYTILFSIPILYLCNKFKDNTLVEYAHKIMGKTIGKLIGILIFIYLSFYCLLQMIQLMLFIRSTIMPETPFYATLFFMLVTCTYIIYKGIECIGRISIIFTPIILSIIILFLLLTIKDMDIKVFLPIYADSTFSGINFGAFNIGARFSDILIIGMIAPNIKKNEVTKVFTYTLIIFLTFFLIVTVNTLAVLGVEQSQHSNFPYFILTRQVDVFDFIQHIEHINVFGWFVGVFIKFSSYLYCATVAIAQVFRTNTNKPFILPTLIILYFLAINSPISKSVVNNYTSSQFILPYITLTFIFILPLILLMIYFIRRKSFINNI